MVVRAGYGWLKRSGIDRVHLREVVHRGEIHVDLDDIVEGEARRREHGSRLSKQRCVCPRDVGVDQSTVAGSIGVCPERKTWSPDATAWE